MVNDYIDDDVFFISVDNQSNDEIDDMGTNVIVRNVEIYIMAEDSERTFSGSNYSLLKKICIFYLRH